MTARSTHLKFVAGAAGAAALAIGAVAAPAVAAAGDVTFTYNCSAPVGATQVTINPGTFPSSIVAGQTVPATGMTLAVTLSQTQLLTLEGATADHIRGSLSSTGAFSYSGTLPSTALDNPPPAEGQTIQATGVTGTLRPTSAGSYTVKAATASGSLTASNSGTDIATFNPTCTPPTNGSNDLATVAVTKDTTKTTVKSAYAKSKKTATETATVKSHFGLKPTGSVKFVLTKGSTTKKITAKVNSKGKAVAKFTKITKSGKYKVVATYGGNAALKKSSGTVKFTVK
jgi:hypothetical protein